MKKQFLLAVAFLLAFSTWEVRAQEVPVSGVEPVKEKVLQDTAVENELIDEIVQAKKIPQKDKVEYFSQLTRYGFKNLFSKFSYNPKLPYSSQVNPYAESYMQDYLRGHSKSLLKMR